MILKKETKECYTDFSEAAKELLLEKLKNPIRILIMSHKNPDGDAVGSALGLGTVLESIGHQVKIFLPDDAPDFLKWMPGYENVLTYDRSKKKFPGFKDDPDLVIFLDFNSLERLGGMEKPASKLNSLKFLVDHHPGNKPFYDFGIVNTSKGSTSELVYLLLEKLGLDKNIDGNSASCLYTGIITDTLGLQVSSAYKEVYNVIGNLIESGAEKQKVYNNVYNQFSHDRMKLLGYCLAEKMRVLPDHQVAYIWLTKTELERFNHLKGDTEGFVNYPLSIKNVRLTVLFTELEDEIKLSLRSKGNIPVNEFAAEYFNGGGHKNASGGRSSTSMEETLEKFESRVKDFMKDYI